MTYGGLRGAVAFYLALNLHTPYKDILITLTIVLIFFTVIGLGSTTNCLLKILNCCFPRDKILQDPGQEETAPFRGDIELESDGERSEGVITRLEDFDVRVAQKYLRKNAIRDVDKASEVELDEEDDWDMLSVISKREDALQEFFNRDVRGGDLSPYRKFKANYGTRKKSEMAQSLKRKDKSAPINMWSSMKHKKSEMTRRVHQPDMIGYSGGGFTSAKAVWSKQNEEAAEFSSYLPQPKSTEVRIPLDIVHEGENLKDKSKSMNDTQPSAATKSKRDRYNQKKLSTLHEQDEEGNSEDSDGKVKKKYGNTLEVPDANRGKRSKSTFVPSFSKNE